MDILKKQVRLELEKGTHLSVGKHDVIGNHPLHWHSYFELEIILSGKGKYIINDIAYDLSENNVFLLAPTDFHHLEVTCPIELINISFDEEMIKEKDIISLVSSGIKKAYTFNPEEHKRIVNASDLLEYECDISGNCQKQLLQYILNCVFRKNEAQSVEHLSECYCHGIKKAIVYMQM